MKSKSLLLYLCLLHILTVTSCKDDINEPEGASISCSDFAGSGKENIILILTDDQRFDALSLVQHTKGGRASWLQTPNLDLLASQGSLFENAFVTTALCAPSRAAILTGQYNHINGIEDNHGEFYQTSYASILQENGYETAYFGKWHMGKQQGKRPGFDNSYSFIGQGAYFDADFEINGYSIPTKGWVDKVSTDYLIQELEGSHTKPFCYVIGYKTPHGPWEKAEEEASSLYTNEKLSVVPSMGVSPIYLPKKCNEENSFDGYWDIWGEKDLVYYQNITAMDKQVGRILKTLEEQGLDECTTIIFSSDNGFYQGEHCLRNKITAFEESMRVPFIVKRPQGNTKPIVDEFVLNIDIAPTILELAGLSATSQMQGRSILSLLNPSSENLDWRESFVYRFQEKDPLGPKFSLTALRTRTHKLVTYDNKDWVELYDLTSDPYEINNLRSNKELLNQHLQLLEEEKKKIQLP